MLNIINIQKKCINRHFVKFAHSNYKQDLNANIWSYKQIWEVNSII